MSCNSILKIKYDFFFKFRTLGMIVVVSHNVSHKFYTGTVEKEGVGLMTILIHKNIFPHGKSRILDKENINVNFCKIFLSML